VRPEAPLVGAELAPRFVQITHEKLSLESLQHFPTPKLLDSFFQKIGRFATIEPSGQFKDNCSHALSILYLRLVRATIWYKKGDDCL
jgi:hypothetical protein